MLVNDKVEVVTGTRTPTTAAALTVTMGLAAAAWVVAVRQMNGMNMGAATQLGSFAVFFALWGSMMAAMMVPGAAPAVVRRAHAAGVRGGALFRALCPAPLDIVRGVVVA